MKQCFRCGKLKELHDFVAHKLAKEGRANTCKECKRLQHRAWRHGISTKAWFELYAAQKGCCAICRRHESLVREGLVLDHCHSTGVVRGLLCHPCNVALGLMEDSPERLTDAVLYLTEAKSKTLVAV